MTQRLKEVLLWLPPPSQTSPSTSKAVGYSDAESFPIARDREPPNLQPGCPEAQPRIGPIQLGIYMDSQFTTYPPPCQTESDIRKMELLQFDGNWPEIWLYQAESYFTLHQMVEEAKLRAARICFIGSAQIWLQIEENKHPFVTWIGLKTQMSRRFRGAQTMAFR